MLLHANTPRASGGCHVVNHCPPASRRAVRLPWQPITNAIILVASQRRRGGGGFLDFQSPGTLLACVGEHQDYLL